MLVTGEITGKWGMGINVYVPLEPAQIEKLHDIGAKHVTVELHDRRYISAAQRRKAYVLLNAISAWAGYTPVEIEKVLMKRAFLAQASTMQENFSLSNCSMTVARQFITYLIDFIIANDIPTKVPLIEQCEDVSRYIYSCLVNKKCCICGKPADLHHVQSVGSQGYRDKINHIGLEALPLCREHHISLHSMGNKEFIEKWHLEPVRIDAKIAKLYKLNKGK